MNNYYRKGGPYSRYNYRTLKRSRLMIHKDLLNSNTVICFTDMKSKRNFCYVIDHFYDWLLQNTQCLKTKSWTENGIYNWPYVPEKYFNFLNDYEVDSINDNLRVSDKRDYSSFESRCNDLKKIKNTLGHCCTSLLTSDDLVDRGISESIEEAQSFLNWVDRTRYYFGKFSHLDLDSPGADLGMGFVTEKDVDEYNKLREIGFIFHENLSHYFNPLNKSDRTHLITLLEEANDEAFSKGL